MVRRSILYILLSSLLLVPNYPFTHSSTSIKSADKYWADTGLNSSDLEFVLSNEACSTNERSFLACVNALNKMGERYNLIVSKIGTWRDTTPKDVATEKITLSKWKPVYANGAKVRFLSLWRELDKKAILPEQRASVIASGINGYLSVAHDPHTYIIPIAEYEEVIATSETKQDKLGFIFRKIKDQVIVRKIFPGTSADKAGLKRNDEIVTINGSEVKTLSPLQIGDLLRVPSGQRVSLAVLRDGEKKSFEILKTDSVYSSVNSSLIPGRIPLGLLTLNKFSKDLCIETKAQLIRLVENGAKGILLDLRDNPGGQLDEAACVANLFIARGETLFSTRYLEAGKPGDAYIAENESVYNGPLAVLINSGSASASEILAGTLRDHGRASLVGERSFGKGSFQDGRVWAQNSKIALFETEGLYYFPSGWTPQLVGLEPDLPVNFNHTEDRESDLYWVPIHPKETPVDFSTLSWLGRLKCDPAADLFSLANAGTNADLDTPTSEDNQVREAVNWLNCKQKWTSAAH